MNSSKRVGFSGTDLRNYEISSIEVHKFDACSLLWWTDRIRVSRVCGTDPCGLISLRVPLMTPGMGTTQLVPFTLTKVGVSVLFLSRTLPVPQGLQS